MDRVIPFFISNESRGGGVGSSVAGSSDHPGVNPLRLRACAADGGKALFCPGSARRHCRADGVERVLRAVEEIVRTERDGEQVN
jgi:hypothetical protein